MHTQYIEYPLGYKVKFKRCVAPAKQGKLVEPLHYRFRKTHQQLRRSRLRWYRITHGKPYLWPPLKGSEEDLWT